MTRKSYIFHLKDFRGLLWWKQLSFWSELQTVSKRGHVCLSICFSQIVERFCWHYKKATWDGWDENCRQPKKWKRPKNKDYLRNEDDLKNEKDQKWSCPKKLRQTQTRRRPIKWRWSQNKDSIINEDDLKIENNHKNEGNL